METVTTLRAEAGCDISDVVAIFSYELLSSREKAQELGVHLHPLSTITTLLDVAKAHGRISEEDVREVARFIADPEGWRR